MKHSPAPWTAESTETWNPGSRSGKCWVVHLNGTPLIATVGQYPDEPDAVPIVSQYYGEEEANARLIAAAPDLLAALIALVGEYPDLGEVDLEDDDREKLDAARAAISKAQPTKPAEKL